MELKRQDRPLAPDGLSLWSASTLLILALGMCFAIQQIVIVRMEKPYDAYLALSGYGMKSGHLWELITYQCFHTGLVHFMLNVAGLWFLGRKAERRWGSKKFVLIFQGAVLAGGVVQGAVALAGFLLPESQEVAAAFIRDRFGGPVAGSTVGLCGVLGAFCRAQPQLRLFGIGTLSITLRQVYWMAVFLALGLVVYPSDPYLAHLAHLAAFLLGLAFPAAKRELASAKD